MNVSVMINLWLISSALYDLSTLFEMSSLRDMFKEVRVKSLINFVAIMMSVNCMTQCRVRMFVKYCKRKKKVGESSRRSKYNVKMLSYMYLSYLLHVAESFMRS
jgi:hypothetical protein